jgi:hypothetical protein
MQSALRPGTSKRPELHRTGHGAADVERGVAVSGFEIRSHGHDATDVLEHPLLVQRFSVRQSAGPRDARAGRSDGREADLLKDAGGTGIPGVGEHETGRDQHTLQYKFETAAKLPSALLLQSSVLIHPT